MVKHEENTSTIIPISTFKMAGSGNQKVHYATCSPLEFLNYLEAS